MDEEMPISSVIAEMNQTTPPRSRTSSASSTSQNASPSRKSKANMSLDLSTIPPLSEPAPPSNTLLVTNLQDPAIFAPSTLTHLQTLISDSLLPTSEPTTTTSQPTDDNTTHPPQQLLAFSPLPSLRRIILTFSSPAASLRIRTLLDGSSLFSHRIRCYFGINTDVSQFYPAAPSTDGTPAPSTKHLHVPKAAKQFFISPPPSPPAGWEMRDEEPPNKEVHPGDLSKALQRLERAVDPAFGADGGGEKGEREAQGVPSATNEAASPTGAASTAQKRGRAGSTPVVVYHPTEHGSSADLPAIAVEDTGVGAAKGEGEDGDEADAPEDNSSSVVHVEHVDADLAGSGTGGGKKIIAHTSRPPVELMR